MKNESPVPLSESMQMYLVTIARLREDNQPVPLSRLAEALSVSPVSVNEMCWKLQDQGLVVYRPYKGASLTPTGEQRAYHILRRHRLWEVFLVNQLGFAYTQAHEAACQLEHSTPKDVADRLDAFLGHPRVNPQGDPIPDASGDLPSRPTISLAALSAGQQGHIVRCDVGATAGSYLDERGVRPGAALTVMATAPDSMLVQVGERHISLARTLAHRVQVETEEIPDSTGPDAPLCTGK